MIPATKVRFLVQALIFTSVSLASCQWSALAHEHNQEVAPAPQARSSGMTQNTVDILTPTEGVDFSQYIKKVVGEVRKNWYASMPDEAYGGAKGRTVVLLRIQTDGKIVNVSMESSSGSDSLDQAAMNGIRTSSPFDPLSPQFKGPYVDLRFRFLYNLGMDTRKSLVDCDEPGAGSNQSRSFDRLELLSFLGDPGPLPYAAKAICERGTDFVPDSGFLATLANSGLSPAFVESLKSIKPKSVSEPSPERVDAYALVDSALTDKHHGQLATADEEYARALKLAPDSATLRLAYARNLLAEHKYSEAEIQSRQSLALWPEDAEGHYALAVALSGQHRDGEATPEAREALRIFPSHSLALIWLGISLTRSGNYKEAVPVLRESLPHAPQLPVIYKHLGGSLVHTGEFDEAILDLNLYLKTNSNDAEAHYFLGVALRAKGRSDEALAELREAERLEPGNPIYSVATGATDSTDTASGVRTPPEPRPDDGFFSGNLYTNTFFGFSYEYPNNWIVLNADRGRALLRLSGSIMANQDPTVQDSTEAAARDAFQLLLVTKETTTDVSTSVALIDIQALSTRFGPDLKSGADFLTKVVEHMQHAGTPISVVEVPKQFSAGGRIFWKIKLDFTVKGVTSHVIDFAAIDKGYVLLFTFSGRNDATIEGVATTMQSFYLANASR
jgi:TonB family protein